MTFIILVRVTLLMILLCFRDREFAQLSDHELNILFEIFLRGWLSHEKLVCLGISIYIADVLLLAIIVHSCKHGKRVASLLANLWWSWLASKGVSVHLVATIWWEDRHAATDCCVVILLLNLLRVKNLERILAFNWLATRSRKLIQLAFLIDSLLGRDWDIWGPSKNLVKHVAGVVLTVRFPQIIGLVLIG